MSAGSVTLGTNLSVAVGPLGRNGEASGSINTNGKISATYSYSKTRGLFGGVSLEGSVIVERQDANAIAYGDSATAKQLLSGVIDAPSWASALIKTLELRTSLPGGRKWVDDSTDNLTGYAFGGIPSPSSEGQGYAWGKKRSVSSPFVSWNHKRSASSSYFSPEIQNEPPKQPFHNQKNSNALFEQHFDTDYGLMDGERAKKASDFPLIDLGIDSETFDSERQRVSPAEPDKITRHSKIAYKPTLTVPLAPGEIGRVIALYDFQAREPGDLSFVKGDIISVIERSESVSDWCVFLCPHSMPGLYFYWQVDRPDQWKAGRFPRQLRGGGVDPGEKLTPARG
jgi:hypothetical protein